LTAGEIAGAYSCYRGGANALAPAVLADATRTAGIPLIHLSTDYVFSGDKPAPDVEDDPVAPLGVYGASKLAGEMAVRLGNPRSVVLRTAWVLSAHGKNFLKTMRRLSATRHELPVVADQIGCPTSAADIAVAVQVIARAHRAEDLPRLRQQQHRRAVLFQCDLMPGADHLRQARGPRREAPRQDPVLAGWEVRILADPRGIDGLARQIKSTAMAYPLFDLAQLILEKPERYLVELQR